LSQFTIETAKIQIFGLQFPTDENRKPKIEYATPLSFQQPDKEGDDEERETDYAGEISEWNMQYL